MFGDIFGNPYGLRLMLVVAYSIELGHWVAQFALDTNVFWQVNFMEQTDPDAGIEAQTEMRKMANKMFADEIRRRLMGE